MPYGTVKVDNITFTNGGVDTTITVSGLAASTTGDLTVTGTISGAVVRATTVSGATVTGTTVQGASGTFTSITGGIATITSGVFALGSAAAPSISFSSDPNTGIYSPGADQVAISTNGAGRLFIDDLGRLGIGTSAPATNLDIVVGSGTATQKLGSSLVTGGSYLNLHGASASKTWFIGANYNFAGVLEFTQSTTNGGTTPSSTPAMVLSAAGNVGIATQSPAATLHIRADNAGSGSTPLLIQNRSISANTAVGISFAPNTSDTADRSAIIYGVNSSGGSGNATDLTFHTNANGGSPTERMRITSAGLVGIGTTAPNRKLEVSDASVDNFIRVNTTGATKSGIEFASGGTVYSQLYFNNVAPYDLSLLQQYTTGSLILGTNSTERMRITNSGRVGINQSSPATTFDLSGAYSTNVVSVAALDIDCSAGTYFTKTINGASTFTVSNVPASRSYAFTLEVNHTSGTITWFSGVEWPGGTAPTLTTGKTHLFMFVTDNSGSRWRASSLINYTT